MNVASILHKALAHDINSEFGFDLTSYLASSREDLKAMDSALVRVLDEYGSRDCLYRENPECYKVSADSRLLTLYRTFLNYTYKVEVAPTKHQINETSIKFLERNRQCAEWTKVHSLECQKVRRGKPQGSPLQDLLTVARYLCHKRTAGYRTPGKPAHGPGVTSNAGSRRIDKYASLQRDIPDSLRRFAEWFVPSPAYLPEFKPMGWTSECKLRAVPKDARGPRLIAPHSAAHMWMQQAIADRLCRLLVKQEQWYKYHPLFDSQMSTIQFDDQLVNAGLSLFGSSRPGLYGTLDLSDASDRIPWSLVTTIMPPRLTKDLTAVRARKVKLPDNSSHRIHMHAPMGSACCFPVLSLVAWSVACAAIWLETHTLKELGKGTIPSEFEYVWVFGDDIVINPLHYTAVSNAFSSVNLTVNLKKSFCGPGGFRESCGLDAYECAEVTPVRLKVDGVSSVSDLHSLVAHVNNVGCLGLPHTHKAGLDLIEVCADELGCRHLIGATNDNAYNGCCVILPTEAAKRWNRNGGVVTRVNKRLQRGEIRVLALKDGASQVNPDLDSRSRLFEGVLGNRARQSAGWARNRPRSEVAWVPFWRTS